MSKGSNSPSRRPRTFSSNDPNLFLVPNIRGDFNDPSNDGSGYGAAPGAEQNQTYLAYFDGVGGTGPEIIDQTAYFIKYLIDTEGNVTNPEPGTISLLNLTSNFELGKRAVVEGSTLTQTNLVGGPFNITGVGRISPILVTETGSNNPDYISTMSFGTSSITVADVSAQFILTNSSSLLGSGFTTLTTSSGLFQIKSFGTNWDLNPDNVQITTSTSASNSRIQFKFKFSIARLDSLNTTPSIQFRILKQGAKYYDSDFFPLPKTTVNSPTVISFDMVPYNQVFWDSAANDEYKVQYRLSTSNTGLNIKLLGTNNNAQTVMNVVQETPPSALIDGVNAIFTDYVKIILDYPEKGYSEIFFDTTSLNIYNAGLTQFLDPASQTFGFSKITIPFKDIAPGDFIRFEYNKNQVYMITEVTTDKLYGTFGPFLKLIVTPNIGFGPIGLPNGGSANTSITEKNHFAIYRIINDGTYVILDVPKLVAGDSFSGILQPEYISQELKDKYSDIIQKLTLEGIIT
jgi:hypothetical protein